MHDGDSTHFFRGFQVNGCQLGVKCLRPDDTAMQHAGPADIRRIAMLAGHDILRIHFWDRRSGGGVYMNAGANRLDELLPLGEFADTNGISRTVLNPAVRESNEVAV